MSTTGKSFGSLHPDTPKVERLAETSLSRERQLDLYRLLRLTRMVEGRLGNLYRQNKVVGGLYTSLGQEATAVGSAYALEAGDFIGPLIRNLGSMLVRGVLPREVMMQYMARGLSPTGGKDGNTHFGDLARGIVAPISMLGAVIPVMAGVALAAKMQGRPLVALTYIGDGGTSTGDFHEGLNLAAVLDVPFVLIAEHNGYAYSTPTSRQMKIKHIVSRAAAYGIPGEMVDGNDVLAVYEVTKKAVERARAGGGPTLIEAKTFRMKGHAEHDDAGYVPPELFEEWRKKDPIDRFERHLLGLGLATPEDLQKIVAEIDRGLDAEVDFALASPMPPPERALEGVYEPDPEGGLGTILPDAPPVNEQNAQSGGGAR
ncbi:MAG TPA: thiamine pyrophosphate-dependent dehydrogenase E1 component subunit alpha [Thermoanaerobaculia bacterium]|jgi:pyruvate dehydrogenase E1 component alpha subunit/2-oxoisovalerate dehydrogenase E1 component alpha subunit|nr:thiamine pyrophosphate-dependent dehydrogenase E1 component subunit alpha [Thermoanaerobaculia bacterium]